MLNISHTHHFDFEDNEPLNSHQVSPREANPTPSMDIPMLESMWDDDLDENLGFVDINSFCQLQSCFENLSKSHANLNQNVIMFTKFLTNSINNQPVHATRNASMPRALASPLHAHSMHDTHTLSIGDPTIEIAQLLKNLKPLVFKGVRLGDIRDMDPPPYQLFKWD